jgi:hypothetical protein
MARKDRSGERGYQNKPTKRTRRRGTPGQGRLRQRQITAVDFDHCAEAGNIPPAHRHAFEQWLRSTLEFSWLVDQHYRTPKTLAAKKAELAKLYDNLHRLRVALEKPHIRAHVLGAGLQQLVFNKAPMTVARHQKMAQATANRVRGVVRYTQWLDRLVQRDLSFLDVRPESGDERKARHAAASKPAVNHLTNSIIDYWQGQLRRAPQALTMAQFSAAVFTVAGESGVTTNTALERLKAAIAARIPR